MFLRSQNEPETEITFSVSRKINYDNFALITVHFNSYFFHLNFNIFAPPPPPPIYITFIPVERMTARVDVIKSNRN